MKRPDKEQIQPDVHEAGENQKVERRSGIAQCPLDGGGIVVQGDHWHGGTGDAHIGDGIRQDVGRRSHPGENGGDQREGEAAGDKGNGQEDIGGIDNGPLYHFRLVRTEILGGDNPAAAADAVAEGKEEEGNGTGRADGGQGAGPQQPSDNGGIGQHVGLLEKVADQEGKSEHGQKGKRFPLCHVHDMDTLHGGPF